MFTPSRKTLGKHPLTRKRSNLPSTNSIIWIVFVIIVLITCGLLGGVMYIVTSTSTSLSEDPVHQNRHHHEHHHVGLDAQKAKDKFTQKAREILQSLRVEFQARYGPVLAQKMQQKGIALFGKDGTAHRILYRSAARNNNNGSNTFEMAFTGYSVTVGRGNFFHESYPFVLQTILKPAFEQIFQLNLVVRNAAIGGIPSFPYGFCLTHFLGQAPDVISWDYAMNENGKDNTAVLESYIRHARNQLGRPKRLQQQYGAEPPVMLISLDTHKGRCDLLQTYTELGLLPNAMCVGRADNVLTKADFLSAAKLPPPGLQQWDEFGAPPSCPGRSSWHPKKKEHEFIAWMIAMEFVTILERAVEITQTDPDWIAKYGATPGEDNYPYENRYYHHAIFPKPLSKQLPHNPDPAIAKLLYGHESSNGDVDVLEMHDVSCRTNFLPATDTDKVLPHIVVSGLSDTGPTAENIMQERSDADYQHGWVLDVSAIERTTKQKVEQCGGLGYLDMKIALYGIPESGPLRLWLPVELQSHVPAKGASSSSSSNGQDLQALHWFDSLILCEANEKRTADACQLHQDLELTVGGVTSTKIQVINGVGEYLKRPTCVHVTIPEAAQMVPLSKLTAVDGSPLTDDVRKRLSHTLHENAAAATTRQVEDPIGLVVDVKAASRVTRKAGACCLSHVAWELL